MAECRTCGRPILWVVVAATNKRMPLNPDPDPTGNVVRLSGDTVRVLTHDERTKRLAMPGGPGPLYLSHFATCRDSAAHRKDRSR